jgi:hypothetical protein
LSIEAPNPKEIAMKALGTALFALAILSGVCGMWIAMASLSWASLQAWTWDSDDEDDSGEDDE